MAAITAKEKQQAAIDRTLATLAELGGELLGEDTIARHDAATIIIPRDMEKETAVSVLQRSIKDEQQVYNISRIYKYRPYDGARAVAHVLKDYFGWAIGMPVKTFFGTNPPQLISIEVGVGQTEQVPWGRLQLVHFGDGYIELGAARDNELGTVFSVTVYVRQRYKGAVEGLLNLFERYLRANSIYRGQAITASETPSFIDLAGVEDEDVVYTEQVMEDIKVFVWANILYTQALRDLNQLGKRVTIAHGTYGVGKTLMALLTAKRCLEQRGTGNDVTFIFVRPGVDNWMFAIQLARLYGRCVIFIEDADLLIDPHNSQSISVMLDQFDGLITKGMDMSLVMTTNHIDKIHKGMLRPGRIDGVIEIGNMDQAGVERLAKRVIGTMLAPNINWANVFEHAAGYTPAYIREILDRSLRRNIVRNDGVLGEITEHDLIGAADNLRPQLALMEGAPEAKERAGLDGTFARLIDSAVDEAVHVRLNNTTVVRNQDDSSWGRLLTD